MLRKTLGATLVALSLITLTPPAQAAVPCPIGKAATAPALGTLYGAVVDTVSGKTLYSMRSGMPTPSASVMKLFTGAAALMYLPDGHRAETSVWSVDSDPTAILVKAGGDHTLSRLMPPSYTTYAKPAKLGVLAQQTLLKLPVGTKITKIIIDNTYFKGRAFNPYWLPSDRWNGYVSPITSFAVDAARVNPDLTDTEYSGIRVSDPEVQAATYFRKALGPAAAGAEISFAYTPDLEDTKLTSVFSAPMKVWVDHAMKVSDNTETEYLIRQVLKYATRGTNFTDIQGFIKEMLVSLGISPSGLVMKDAAGLAQADRVTARLVAQLLREAAIPGSPIGELPATLATTSSVGTLNTRFNGPNSVARGNVQAKTGYIPGLYSLAGYVKARDGHRLAFAFFARGKATGAGTRQAIDTLVARVYTCGIRLTK